MPWKECHVMDERLRFVARLLEGEKMAPLCAEFGISRKTGYKIFDRYKDCGVGAFNDRRRQPIRLPMRPPAPVAECGDPAVFMPVVDLVPGLPGDPELGAEGRHLLALEQAGDKPQPLVHDVTLLPRHAPSLEGAKVSPMCPEYGVTS